MKLRHLLPLLLITVHNAGAATDWSAQLRERADAGEAVELTTLEEETLLGLYRPARGEAKGGLLIVHDWEGHADADGVTGPLRRQLPREGWNTLAIQLQLTLPPLPESESATELEDATEASAEGEAEAETPPTELPTEPPAEDDAPAEATEAAPAPPPEPVPDLLTQARPQIATAVEHLRSQGATPIILIGHGFGALAITDYISEEKPAGVTGVVAIGMGIAYQLDGQELPHPPRLMAATGRPTLDIFGSRDRRDVLDQAAERDELTRQALADAGITSNPAKPLLRYQREPRRESPGYRQLRMEGADHDFVGHSDRLVRRVRGWLETHRNANYVTSGTGGQ